MATVHKIVFPKFKLAAQISTEFVLINGTSYRRCAGMVAEYYSIKKRKHVIFVIFVRRHFEMLIFFNGYYKHKLLLNLC